MACNPINPVLMAQQKTITDNSLAKISKWNSNGVFELDLQIAHAIKIFVNASLVALKKELAHSGLQ